MSEKKGYNPHEFEEKFYKIWEERGYFEPDGNEAIQKEGKNFCIMMPPPNVTGSLHIGHALTFTLQDIMVRYKRMDGFKTLWQPGTDHAGIATQNVVEKQLLAEGKTKEELGREAFLERVWKWKEHSGGMIVHQMRKLGVSPAWSRERFTMDEGLKNAVKKAFVQLYDEGLIVKGNYMVNWCTHDGALSDIEVEYEEHNGKLYHIRYPLADEEGYVVVATTRPETYFGDTAVMVHPDDERYKHLIGKKVRLPLIDREISVIADEHVDMEFGTGVVKVTPAHDPNDYEVGKRHNLDFITVFDEKGILNKFAGEFEGHERLDAREKIVARLDEEGFIEKIEEHTHQVGHCYRCHNVVEPYISKQWFVKKEIATRAIEKVNAGEAKFFPSHWINSYNAWMNDLRDWCISRQLWWGHRIPVFYCDDCGHEWATHEENPDKCPKCGSTHIKQDPDVLDTWFSSALWPFSTLGWGNGEALKNVKWFEGDLKSFYPNDLLITGFDILFFWVARMIMMGEHFMGELPFRDIYLHALVRDEHGNKMSKSRGNVIDPLDTIEQYSADALRFTLAVLAVQGRDIKLSNDKLELSRNFTNKLYNAAKYLQMNVETFDNLENIEVKTPLGRYMLSRFALAAEETRSFIDQYRFNDAATTLYRFLWGEFCDWGIELSKASKESVAELGAIFKEAMKLLHPFMPFITEYLWHQLSGTTIENDGSIMVQPYPAGLPRDESIENEFSLITEAIVSIRRAKATVDMPGKKIEIAYIKPDTPMDAELASPFIKLLAKTENVEFVENKVENAITDVSDHMEVYLPLTGIDLKPILERLEKQQAKLTKEVVKLSSMLNNEKFVANAPAHVVEENKKALEEAQGKLKKVEAELLQLTQI
ncbi:valine--tRNA ligase [Hydrogenimonas cancrithermarum]|uniref:Valine--tRNA ligase n=1 Tax=Hydrogenimonas cancrithermarum TaxID=2993563 RepID=A0ABN6WSM0_9BACT|nr:valine--tRNA ligase [Hydrogenimonas cancrithermarum]BDY11983.1 valine--tRNA ligase [Hydrogenimonas cancrithermarum]